MEAIYTPEPNGVSKDVSRSLIDDSYYNYRDEISKAHRRFADDFQKIFKIGRAHV